MAEATKLNGVVTIATCEPYVTDWVAEIAAHTRKTVRRVLASPAEIARYTAEFYSLARSVRNAQKNGEVTTSMNFEQLVELGLQLDQLDPNMRSGSSLRVVIDGQELDLFSLPLDGHQPPVPLNEPQTTHAVSFDAISRSRALARRRAPSSATMLMLNRIRPPSVNSSIMPPSSTLAASHTTARNRARRAGTCSGLAPAGYCL